MERRFQIRPERTGPHTGYTRPILILKAWVPSPGRPLPSPKQAKASGSANPAASHFLQESFRPQTDSKAGSVAWRGNLVERRPDRQRGRGKRENSEGSLKLEQDTSSREVSTYSTYLVPRERVSRKIPREGYQLVQQ